MELTLAVLALALILVFAMVRPRGWSEAVVALPAAGVVVAAGSTTLPDAAHEVGRLLPVVGFLATVLVLSRLCDDEGLFRAAGNLMARVSTGRSQRLLVMVFAVAAGTTAVLSLDATVVLLTPVVLATAGALAVPARPHAYATAHLANTASLLLPVSNLTNLLAFAAAGITFLHFTALMALPWLAAIAVEFLILRWVFARDLRVDADSRDAPEAVAVPRFVLVVLALTLIGFAVTSLLGWSPAWAALAGAVVIAVPALARRVTTAMRIATALDVPFLVFVLCLGVVVDAVVRSGLGDAMRAVLPGGTSLGALFAIAAVAAVLSNVVNNLPAVLVLLPIVSASGPAAVLAVLLGVNIGPNLSYVGSLANLLWRGVVRRDMPTGFGEFTRVGLCTVPATLVTSVLGLWLGIEVFGL